MVNTGKPSKGCYMCRARRIKCDEGKPSCLRCQKSKRVCPGYRDTNIEINGRHGIKFSKKNMPSSMGKLDQLFREDGAQSGSNQMSIWTGGHANSHRRNNSLYLNPSSSTYGDYSELTAAFTSPAIQSPTIYNHLSMPVEIMATNYFMSDFVLSPQNNNEQTRHLHFLIPLLKASKPNSTLHHTFMAVAMAAFASRPNSKNVSPMTNGLYSKALKSINKSLMSPSDAMEDATLASVMLLSTFEQISGSDGTNSGWATHVEGAVALIQSRGKKQFETQVGRDLFLAVRAHMVIQCIGRSIPLPGSIDWWLSQVEEDEEMNRFSYLGLHAAEIRADVEKVMLSKERTPETRQAVLLVLRRAQELETQIAAWCAELPSSWHYRTEQWIPDNDGDMSKAEAHPGRLDSYPEVWKAFIFNVCRAGRLYTQTSIVRCVAWLIAPNDYTLTPEYATARSICSSLITDVVASVPYFFTWKTDSHAATFATSPVSSFNFGARSAPVNLKAVSGVFILWPMYTAAASDFATPSQRAFLSGRLKAIHEITGVNQAEVLKNAVYYSHPSLDIFRDMYAPSVSSTPQQPGYCRRRDALQIIPTPDSEPFWLRSKDRLRSARTPTYDCSPSVMEGAVGDWTPRSVDDDIATLTDEPLHLATGDYREVVEWDLD